MTKTAAEMIMGANAQVGHVSPKDAAEEVVAGTAVMLDVREAEEWQHGHIEGAVPATRGLVEFFADPTSPRHKAALDPTGRVIVVCASGARDALAALTLQDLGYEDVAVLDGGFKAWMEAGLPTNAHEYAGI
jgi:rhodanese-related sulfurtransferase